MSKRTRRSYTEEFKYDAVRLVTEQGYSVAEAARNLGVHANLLRSWKQKLKAEEESLTEDERMELASLRAENKRLRMERDILKKVVPSKPGRRGLRTGVGETSHRNPAGRKTRPAKCNRQPEASLAWCPGNRRCEA